MLGVLGKWALILVLAARRESADQVDAEVLIGRGASAKLRAHE
jgi:hypothetical protein